MEADEANLVREFINENDLAGEIFLVEDTKRYYPYGSVASQILGFVGTDNTGLYGIEYTYEKTPQGTPGRIIAAKRTQRAPTCLSSMSSTMTRRTATA